MTEASISNLCVFLLQREKRIEERPHRKTATGRGGRARGRDAVPLIEAIFRPIWPRGDMPEHSKGKFAKCHFENNRF